jgi:hypothetical protein
MWRLVGKGFVFAREIEAVTGFLLAHGGCFSHHIGVMAWGGSGFGFPDLLIGWWAACVLGSVLKVHDF